MFNCFRKKQKINLPEIYTGIISIDQYEILLKKCLSILEGLGYEIISSDNGKIEYKIKNEVLYFFLDSLVRKFNDAIEDEKEVVITDYFAEFQNLNKRSVF